MVLTQLAANPNNVLSAIAEGYVTEAATLHVELIPLGQPVPGFGFALSDGGSVVVDTNLIGADAGLVDAGPGAPVGRAPISGSTPEMAIPAGGFVLPVLGLVQNTGYSMIVVGTNAQGQTLRSARLTFTTGPLPYSVTSFATFQVTQPAGAVAPGFVALSKNTAGVAPPIPEVVVDRNGQVVWYVEESPAPDGDFQQQPDGTYTIAVAGIPFSAEYTAVFLRVDALGNLIDTYTVPGPDAGTDCHEMRVLPDGDVMLLGGIVDTQDMSPFGGTPDTGILGNTVVRLHPDGSLAFWWSSLDHTTLADVDFFQVDTGVSVTSNPLDAAHANSIDIASDGNYLVSARQMSQVWKIDATSGALLWKLGYHGDFAFVDDPLGGFSGQHFARETAPDRILLFDDGNGHDTPTSRAVEYQLAFGADGGAWADGGPGNTATLVWSYTPVPPVFALAQGSAQRLANGDTLIDYGTISRVDEVDANGNLVWQMVDTNPSGGLYRAEVITSLY